VGYHLKKAGECVGEGVEQLQHEEEAVLESEAHVGSRLLLALDLDLASAGKPWECEDGSSWLTTSHALCSSEVLNASLLAFAL